MYVDISQPRFQCQTTLILLMLLLSFVAALLILGEVTVGPAH